jgi:hypothetical protein
MMQVCQLTQKIIYHRIDLRVTDIKIYGWGRYREENPNQEYRIGKGGKKLI